MEPKNASPSTASTSGSPETGDAHEELYTAEDSWEEILTEKECFLVRSLLPTPQTVFNEYVPKYIGRYPPTQQEIKMSTDPEVSMEVPISSLKFHCASGNRPPAFFHLWRGEWSCDVAASDSLVPTVAEYIGVDPYWQDWLQKIATPMTEYYLEESQFPSIRVKSYVWGSATANSVFNWFGMKTKAHVFLRLRYDGMPTSNYSDNLKCHWQNICRIHNHGLASLQWRQDDTNKVIFESRMWVPGFSSDGKTLESSEDILWYFCRCLNNDGLGAPFHRYFRRASQVSDEEEDVVLSKTEKLSAFIAAADSYVSSDIYPTDNTLGFGWRLSAAKDLMKN